MAYRYRCGECRFQTRWGTESHGEQQQIAHYTDHHPDLAPGGQFQTNDKDPKDPNGLRGCLTLIAITVLLLLLASSCHH